GKCTGAITSAPAAIIAARRSSRPRARPRAGLLAPGHGPDASGPNPPSVGRESCAGAKERCRLMQVTIAVDAMGGDHGPPVTVAASLQFLEQASDARIVLVGNEAALRECLASMRSAALDRLSVQPASEAIEMHEPP